MKVKFGCKLCSAELGSNWELHLHNKRNHTSKFTCVKCNAVFGQQRYLELHIKVEHEGEQFDCSSPENASDFSSKANGTGHLPQVHSLKETKKVKNDLKTIKNHQVIDLYYSLILKNT